MRKLFITGTNNEKEIKKICKKLEYMGYEGIYLISDSFSYHEYRERMKMLLDCDALIKVRIQNNFPITALEKEEEFANYLDITIYEISDVDRWVADKLIDEIKMIETGESQEEEENNG